MSKLDRARQLGPKVHRRIWAERLGNVMRSWSPTFVQAAAERRTARYAMGAP